MIRLTRRTLTAVRGAVPAFALALLSVAPLTSHHPATAAERGKPVLSLWSDNQHYFQFRGKPEFLLTSGEHYGAVLNPDFDFRPYLDELHSNGLNLTRTFLGTYVENPGAFKINENTLAPAKGKFLCPWARSSVDGYAGGGAKFDLEKWDDNYFRRLKQFVARAGERGIVVEAVLFCPYYDDAQWSLSPFKAGNNTNGIGDFPRTEALTLKHSALVAVQDRFIRKVAAELADADNVYFEICNEPYFGGVTLDWQAHVADVLTRTEGSLPAERRHLIAQNIANGSATVDRANPFVSILNFHYAAPPKAVEENYGLRRPIAFDETGFRGCDDRPYRTEGWDFMFAGGGVYDNLDYSFSVSHPNGTLPVAPPTPGGGGRELRRQLSVLHRYLHELPFARMAPDAEVVRGITPGGITAHFLSEPEKVYAGYLAGGTGATLSLALPMGDYRVEWVSPRTGNVLRADRLRSDATGNATLKSPAYQEDVAVRLVRK